MNGKIGAQKNDIRKKNGENGRRMKKQDGRRNEEGKKKLMAQKMQNRHIFEEWQQIFPATKAKYSIKWIIVKKRRE